jgi:hypothetical protein
VNDLLAHVNRRAVEIQRLSTLDGSNDARAKSARLRQEIFFRTVIGDGFGA